MKLTNCQHACFTLEKDGKLLVVDPGAFTHDLPALENVVGIVVTHEHADHFDPTALGAIIAHSPAAVVYAHSDITRQFGDTLPHQAVHAGDKVTVGPFTLEFSGEKHAKIHDSLPIVANLGVMINDLVYYPGDSFTHPDRAVNTLALPVAAPWLAIGQTFDYLALVKPVQAFPTHDAILSDTGKKLVDTMVGNFATGIGVTYSRPTEVVEVSE